MEIKVAGADAYRAGACNIGPDEIRRRERSGHVGTVTTVGLAAALVAAGAVVAYALVLPTVKLAEGLSK